MIWVGGEIVPDGALTISALDRTFEHGLGLFETLRTWNGRAVLLGRHLARMKASAAALGLTIDPASLPDAGAIAALLAAEGREGDSLLRITASGGVDGGPSVVWMRASSLPEMFAEGVIVGRSNLIRYRLDPLGRHKTLNYWARRIAYEEIRRHGTDEALMTVRDDQSEYLVEGTRTNVFVVAPGGLITPADDGSILPGIMRSVVLDTAGRLGIDVEEDATGRASRAIQDRLAQEVFLTNSVRGIIPVRQVLGFDCEAPGAITRQLRDAVLAWLAAGGDEA